MNRFRNTKKRGSDNNDFPCEEIFSQAEEYNKMLIESEKIEIELMKQCKDEELLQEFIDLHTKMEYEIAKKSFEYGLNYRNSNLVL